MTAAKRRDGEKNVDYVEVAPEVKLAVVRSGSGEPLIIIPGWSQTTDQWSEHIARLSQSHRVLAVDMRGHGKSSKPDHGYRISRLAADLNALINAESLDRITLLGHSMGCAVIWSYLELFGSSKIKKLVLVDQCAAIVFDPGWSDAKRRAAGSIFSADECFNTLNALHGPDGVKVTSDLLRSMTSDSFSEERSKLLLEQNLIMSRENAARLFYDHAFQDWTDVLTRIDLPTLVIGAKGSLVPWQSLVAIGEMIKGATTVIFDIAEGGSHFLFLENQQKFLTIVEDFLEN